MQQHQGYVNELTPSSQQHRCPDYHFSLKSVTKGEASYYTVEVDGKPNPNSAWYYPKTKENAKHIEGYVAFWRGIKVEE